MIPNYIRIQNFMCYREKVAEVDFALLSLACICGPNGSGKSAFVDAITWALWGQTRAISSDDNAVISEGQNEASVVFDFSCNGSDYRVVRRRRKSPKARTADKTTLDLYIKENGHWHNISEAHVSQTGAKIVSILRLTYQTFSASAFIRQGQAADFTQRNPAERKNILAQILNLEEYDFYALAAKTKSAELKEMIAATEGALSTLLALAHPSVNLKEELHLAETEMQNQEMTIRENQDSFNRSQSHLNALEQLEHHFLETQKVYKQKQKNYDKIQTQIAQAQEKQKQAQFLMSRQDEIAEGNTKRMALERQLGILAEKREKFDILTQKSISLQNTIENKKIEIITYEKGKREERQRIIDIPSDQNWEEQLVQAQEKRAQAEENFKSMQDKGDQIAIALAEIRSVIISTKQADNKLSVSIAELREDTQEHCPTCRRELDAKQKESLLGQLEEEKITVRQKILDMQKQETNRKAQLAQWTAQMETAHNDRVKAEKQESLIQGRLSSKREQEKLNDRRMAELNEIINHCSSAITTNSFCSQEREELAQVNQALQQLGYDSLAYQDISTRFTQLKHFQKLAQELELAQSVFASAKTDEEQQLDIRTELETDMAKMNGQLKIWQKDLASIEETRAQLEEKRKKLEEAQKSYSHALAKQAICLSRWEESQKKEKEVALSRKKLVELQTQKGLYDGLQRAFGRNGIPSMITEIAVPEISHEANRLLSKMTDGRLSITLQTIKALKSSGELRETLDIIIGDELGTRQYEMFSGGEKFRIDFAIRIALSKTLAQRSGAPLPIIIIDEGFGTQDQNGIEYLKEAIATIAADFAKVFVITHIEELKEFFPQRINVRKDAEGSVIWVE